MKLVKNFVFTMLLVSTLAVHTIAGEIQTPGAFPPPPQKMTETDESLTPIESTDTQQTGVEALDYLFYEALVALLSAY